MNIEKLIEELKRRENFWLRSDEDPHNISTAVMVALAEVRQAIEAAKQEPPTT